MEQRLDPFYLKSGTANVFDMLIVNSNNEVEYTGANALIAAIVAESAPSSEPPLHPFLLGGL